MESFDRKKRSGTQGKCHTNSATDGKEKENGLELRKL